MAATEVTESLNETALAAEQKTKLVKSLGRFDAVFFIVATIVGLDLIGQAASNGPEAFFWAVSLVVLFLRPLRAGDGRGRLGVPDRGRPLRVGQADHGALLGRAEHDVLLGDQPAVGRRLARVHRHRGVVARASRGSAPADFSDYLFKVLFIWLTIGSRDRLAEDRQVDPDARRDRQGRARRVLRA